MARKTSIDLLEQKIGIAQDEVSKAKKRYDAATSNLQKLLDKREALRNEELLSAVAKSTRSYDEIMQYLEGKSMDV